MKSLGLGWCSGVGNGDNYDITVKTSDFADRFYAKVANFK